VQVYGLGAGPNGPCESSGFSGTGCLGETVIQPFLSAGRGGGPGTDHMRLQFPPGAQIEPLLTVTGTGNGGTGHPDAEAYVRVSRR
jgi:hypothetical protein